MARNIDSTVDSFGKTAYKLTIRDGNDPPRNPIKFQYAARIGDVDQSVVALDDIQVLIGGVKVV